MKQLQVAAIENGTVIDHIPNHKLFDVVHLLKLRHMTDEIISIGYNLKSNKMGKKSLIKISNHYFSDAELNQLAVVAPNVTLGIIKNYEIIEKKKVHLPAELRGIVRCNNPKCITNNEPMPTFFNTVSAEKGVLRCHYCEKEQHVENVKFV